MDEIDLEIAPLNCPSCNRDFELPRREGAIDREDDDDYHPVPRLLPCLHTVCHSCLDENRQKSKVGKVECPVCKRKETIRGVKYLPLNVLSLRAIIKSKTVESMSVCSRCYDDVPSFSWCSSCSSALCEFHHQDHKLSISTSKHEVITFKEISARNLSIQPHLPNIPCPDSTKNDDIHTYCTSYCRTCFHLISANSHFKKHKTHHVDDCDQTFNVMKDTITDANLQSKDRHIELTESVNKIRETLTKLDDNLDLAVADIEHHFQSLHRELQARENELLRRVEAIAETKRLILTKQLSDVTEMVDESKQVIEMTKMLSLEIEQSTLSNISKSSDNKILTASEININKMYIIPMADMIEDRSEELSLKSTKDISFRTPAADSNLGISFNEDDIKIINYLAPTLGCIHTKELDQEIEKEVNLNNKNNESKSNEINNNDVNLTDSIFNNPHNNKKQANKIFFSIRTGTADESDESSHDYTSRREDKASNYYKNNTRECLIVEARCLNNNNNNNVDKIDLAEEKHSKSPSKTNIINGTIDNDINNKINDFKNDDNIVGKIVLFTEFDRKLLNRHELRSFFECIVNDDGTPLMRVTKQFVPVKDY